MSKNYKLNAAHRSSFIRTADELVHRTVKVLERGFPLSVEEVWAGVATPDDRDRFKALRDHGWWVSLGTDMRVWFKTEGVITVPAKVNVMSNRRAFPIVIDDDKPPVFDLDVIDIEQQRAIIKWVNAAVRQRRIEVGAKKLIREFVTHHAGDSLASLYTRWPDFAPAVIENEDKWAERVRDLPRIKRREYDWPRDDEKHYGWYLDNMNRMEAVGGLLAGGQLLPSVEDTSPVRGEVVDWEKQSA